MIVVVDFDTNLLFCLLFFSTSRRFFLINKHLFDCLITNPY